MIKSSIAVDIDCTLSDTNFYWIKTLEAKFGKVGNLTSIEIMKKYVYASKVPQWQTDEARNFMTHLREDSDEQFKLPLIKNADRWVRKINKIIPIKAYLTSRPQKVFDGTKRWLEKYNFPKAKIISRPDRIPHEGGNKWKAKKLKQLYSSITCIIDDSPYLVDALAEDYKGVVFLYKNKYKGSKNLRVKECLDWSDVFSKKRSILSSNQSRIIDNK